MADHQCVRVPHPPIHPTWPSQISTCLSNQSNNFLGGPWTVKRTCSTRSLRFWTSYPKMTGKVRSCIGKKMEVGRRP
jgi:hypothetical protein